MFLRVMCWLAGIGSVYCVTMVALTFVPGVSPLPFGLIVPAVVAAVLCFLVSLRLAGIRPRAARVETLRLMRLAPRHVKAAALAAGAGTVLAIVLTAPSLDRSGAVDDRYVRQGNSGLQIISHAEYERRLRYESRVGFGIAGWFTVLPCVLIAGARRRLDGGAASR